MTLSSSSVRWTILGFHLNLWLVFLSFSIPSAWAYIPASPVNGSIAPPDASGTNGSEASFLNLQWFGGGYQERISYQLVGAESTGISKGALVHFSESHLSNDSTTTPWIALVSCDANATDASDVDDVFTLASDRGAVAALLYSLYSDRCEINPEYADPANFDQLMDIFSTPLLSSSQFIEYQYGAINATKYGHYDAKLLNESGAQINATIANGTINYKGFMFATLLAFNATGTDAGDGLPGNNGVTNTTSSGGGNGPNTSLAMIILYAITGCVSALFCIVIISGAIRAIRHPERYGPRDGEEGGPGQFGAQSRARGLTRAILDTFPVVKFGGSQDTNTIAGVGAQGKDVESSGTNDSEEIDGGVGRTVEMKALGAVGNRDDHHEGKDIGEFEVVEDVPKPRSHERSPDGYIPHSHQALLTQSQASTSQLTPSPTPPGTVSPIPRPRRAASTSVQLNSSVNIVPDSIGRETCPICIVDFEEGDDLRVLPCEGKHRFHLECVDQWLLELSSSCPICREDFHTLETMMTHDSTSDQLEPPTVAHSYGHVAPRPLSGTGARLSRYLRLARRRRREMETSNLNPSSSGRIQEGRHEPADEGVHVNVPIPASL